MKFGISENPGKSKTFKIDIFDSFFVILVFSLFNSMWWSFIWSKIENTNICQICTKFGYIRPPWLNKILSPSILSLDTHHLSISFVIPVSILNCIRWWTWTHKVAYCYSYSNLSSTEIEFMKLPYYFRNLDF